MQFILVILLALGAILDLLLGISFFLDPAAAGADFGLQSPTAEGLSAMRGDFYRLLLAGRAVHGVDGL